MSERPRALAACVERAKTRASLSILFTIILAQPASALAADVYKCTGPQGQVTYSESPCPGQPSVRLDVRSPTDNRDDRRPTDGAEPAAAPTGPAAGGAPPAASATQKPGGYELSFSERQRIANLEQIERMSTAYREQRQAATLEIANIRRGVVARMSAEDLAKKDQYWADLSRLEVERRRVAASQLAKLFANYQ
jgi:hypothetical protein